MAYDIYDDLDLHNGELIRALLYNTPDPNNDTNLVNSRKGAVCYNTTDNYPYYYDGISWKKLPTNENTLLYTNLKLMPEKIGGYDIGTIFDKVNYKSILDGLLYPYQYPEFSDFKLLIDNNVITEYEIGTHFDFNTSIDYVVNNFNNVDIYKNYIISSSIFNIINNSIIPTSNSNVNIQISPIDFNSVYDIDISIEGHNTKDDIFKSTYIVKVRKYMYYYLGNELSSPTTSSDIRLLSKYFLDKLNSGIFNIDINKNTQEFSLYIPSDKNIKVIDIENMNANITDNFTYTNIDITHSNGLVSTYKKCTIYLGGAGYLDNTTFKIEVI